MILKRTGKFCPFLDCGIGCIFFAHNRYWVRIDYEVGTRINPTQWVSGNSCNFLIDGTVKDQHGVVCEEVEVVEFDDQAVVEG